MWKGVAIAGIWFGVGISGFSVAGGAVVIALFAVAATYFVAEK